MKRSKPALIKIQQTTLAKSRLLELDEVSDRCQVQGICKASVLQRSSMAETIKRKSERRSRATAKVKEKQRQKHHEGDNPLTKS